MGIDYILSTVNLNVEHIRINPIFKISRLYHLRKSWNKKKKR